MAALALLAATLVPAGCGDDDRSLGVTGGGEAEQDEARTSQPPVDVEGLIERFGPIASGDYEPLDGPSDLVAKSELVVQGYIGGFSKGRTYASDQNDPFPLETVAMQVSVTEVVKGSLPDESGGEIYVEFYGSDPSSYDAVVPGQVMVLLGLVTRTEDPLPVVVEPEAGRPAGQPLFATVTPQAFLIDDPANERVVQPLDGTEFPGTSFEDFEASDADFPSSKHLVRSPSGGHRSSAPR